MSNLTPAQEALRALAEKATPGAAFIAAANPARIIALLDELAAAREAALFLWDRLDDIDTASDRAKSNDAAYRQIVERIQARRHEVGRVSPDGRTVEFRAYLATPADEGEGR